MKSENDFWINKLNAIAALDGYTEAAQPVWPSP